MSYDTLSLTRLQALTSNGQIPPGDQPCRSGGLGHEAACGSQPAAWAGVFPQEGCMTSDAQEQHEALHHLVDEYSSTGMSRRQFMRRAMAVGLTAAGAIALLATVRTATAAHTDPHESAPPDFCPNVTIFDPGMSSSAIQRAVNNAYAVEQHNQFGSQRYAFLFKPGNYTVNVPVGYYTSVAGLGLLPDDVNINGQVRVEGQGSSGALINFWRSVENMSITIPPTGFEQWAVSQAAPFRRMHVRGRLFLFPFSGFSSGGYIADSQIDGFVINGSQQQWITPGIALRGGWSN